MAAISCCGDFGGLRQLLGEHVKVFAVAPEVQVFDQACAFEGDADAHDVPDGPDLIFYEDDVAVEPDLKMIIGFGAFDLLPL